MTFAPNIAGWESFARACRVLPFLALTATATERVRGDILGQLQLSQPQAYIASFNRANLNYSVVPKTRNSFDTLLTLLQKHKGESGIIYCTSRKETESMAARLRGKGFDAQPYHAGLDDGVRRQTQERFIRDQVSIIVATIAFGMGIDKPNMSACSFTTQFPSRSRATTRRPVARDAMAYPATAFYCTPMATQPSRSTSSTRLRTRQSGVTPAKSWRRSSNSASFIRAVVSTFWAILARSGLRKTAGAAISV